MNKKIRDAWMPPIGDCRVREITEDELKYLRSLDPSLPLVPLRPIGESVSEQENIVSKQMRTIQPVLEEFAKRNQKLKERLAAVEASEERLAEVVKKSLALRVFVYDNPETVANSYYTDAIVALRKRPQS